MMDEPPNHLVTQQVVPGRAILAEPDGALYIGRNYAIHRSVDGGQSWTFETRMPRTPGRRLIELSRLACRAFRQEVRAMVRLPGGEYVAASKKAVYCARPGQSIMRPSRVEGVGDAAGHERLKPPMMISLGPNRRVLWGEYSTTNRDRPSVRMYASDDGGESFHIAFTFPPNDIRHIHNIFFDEKFGHYWVLTGDHGEEPGFARLSADFKSLEWLVRGRQDFRAVCVFDLGDHFVYGTDTEKEPNSVIRLDKQTGRCERIAPLAGSCIYACRFGGWLALSTTVEISAANPSREATLLISRDGDQWRQVLAVPKDRLPMKLFQWGSLILPRGESRQERILLSGQAVSGMDGRCYIMSVV